MGAATQRAEFDPFVDDPEEVPLDRNLLALVLAQVRFPTSVAAGKREVAEQVAEAFADDYPVFDKESTVAIMVTADGPAPSPQADTVWRFRSRERDWQVSLASTFVALDTTAYVSRDDFVKRFGNVLDVVRSIVSPVECSRIGVRYVDRLEGDDIAAQLPTLVRTELLDAHAFPTTSGASLVHSLCDARFAVTDKTAVQMRWGSLPADSTHDPSIKPVSTRSWIFDFDMFDEAISDFDPEVITASAKDFATRAYAFFRWVMSEELLKERGGDV